MTVKFIVRHSSMEYCTYTVTFATDAAADTYITEFCSNGKYFTRPNGKRVFIPPSSFLSAEEL